MNNPNRGDFERMVELAEFGARRHDERRQVEFRVFIAYNTLLALAFYHMSKDTTTQPLVNLPEWSIALILGGIHFVYFLWQIRLARALVNDTSRRNFYLKKAECLLHHLCEDPNNRIHPRTDKYVKVDNQTKKDEISEYELFKMHEPYIVLVSPMWKFWEHWEQLWRDWSRPFQIFIPTALFSLLLTKTVSLTLTFRTIRILAIAVIILSIWSSPLSWWRKRKGSRCRR